jgi:hypothetical protein
LTGSQAITGFPAVWPQDAKVLRYLGTAVNQSADIANKVKEDTGIIIEYVVATTDDVTKRVNAAEFLRHRRYRVFQPQKIGALGQPVGHGR